MGFAAGFGEGFSNSYNQSRAQTARREEADEDRIWQEYIRNKDLKTKAEIAAGARAKQASTLAKMYNVPESFVYDGLESGMTPAQIEEYAKNNSITDTKGAGIQAARAQTVDDEMQGSGLAAAESPVNTPAGPAQTAPVDTQRQAGIDRLAGRTGIDPAEMQATMDYQEPGPQMRGGWASTPNPEPFDSARLEQELIGRAMNGDEAARQQLTELNQVKRLGKESELPTTPAGLTAAIAQATIDGDIEKVRAYQNALFTATRVEAQAGRLAQGPQPGIAVIGDKVTQTVVTPALEMDDQGQQVIVFKGPDGQVLLGARPYMPGEDEDLKEIFKKSDNAEVKAYNEKAAAMPSLYRNAGILMSTVTPEMLSNVAVPAASTLSGAKREIGNIFRIANITISDNPNGEISAEDMDKLGNSLDNMIQTKGLDAVVQDRAAFDALMMHTSYLMGKADGQTGQAFGEKDFARYQQILSNSHGNPETFKKVLANAIATQQTQVDAAGRLLQEQGGMLDRFESTYGWRPPVDRALTVDQMIAEGIGGSSAKTGWDMVRQNETGERKPNGNNESGGNGRSGKTSRGISWSIN